MKLKVGYKWGKVEVIAVTPYEEWSDPKPDPKTGLKTLPGGVKDWWTNVTLRCACGTEFTLDEGEVDKQLHKECDKCKEGTGAKIAAGEVQAPTGIPGRPRHGRELKITCSVALPLDLIQWVRDEADQRRTSVSAVVTDAVLMLMQSKVAKKGEWA